MKKQILLTQPASAIANFFTVLVSKLLGARTGSWFRVVKT